MPPFRFMSPLRYQLPTAHTLLVRLKSTHTPKQISLINLRSVVHSYRSSIATPCARMSNVSALDEVEFVVPGCTTVGSSTWDNAVALVDKPQGWTSFDVCGKIRGVIGKRNDVAGGGKVGKRFGGKGKKRHKVGHAGTLDPMATGLLIVCMGKATKQVNQFTGMTKVYSGSMRLGEVTETYDAEGEITERQPWEHITDEEIENARKQFLGDIKQTPPMHSAIKVEGKKLYELARQGVEVERQARPVHIGEFEITNRHNNGQDLDFRVVCSKGTYIRSLVFDMGGVLKCGAHMTALRRDAIGKYSVENAWKIEDLVDVIKASSEITRLTVEATANEERKEENMQEEEKVDSMTGDKV